MIHCLKIKPYILTAPVSLLYLCANQLQALKKPRLPAAKTLVIIHIDCEQILSTVSTSIMVFMRKEILLFANGYKVVSKWG